MDKALHAWEAVQDILEQKGWIEITWLETTLSGPEPPYWIAPIEPMDLAAAVLAHIDTVYPKMRLSVSKSARISLRNTIARLARGLPQHPQRTAQQRPPRTCIISLPGKDDCFAVGEVNQQALFGQVAAVVHHGGAGTTTTAARAGVPQVIVPQVVDQPYWARRVNELGIGVAHDGSMPTFESLTAALKTALAPETRAQATIVANTIRADGAAVAAKLLLNAINRK